MKPLDKYGEFLMHNLRDRAIGHHIKLQKGEWKSPAIQELQAAVAALPEETKRLLLRCIVDAVDVATHDRETGIEVLADGNNVAEVSDGLQGEPYGERGWIARYSKYHELQKNT